MDSPQSSIHSPQPSSTPSSPPKTFYHTLPHPRLSGPLKPGSRPESNLIAYLDAQLLQISRKYVKKFNEGGYICIKSIVEDLERLVDLIWVSSTPTLQIHYLLQIANSFNDYLASFPSQLGPTLRLLDTFDRCFYTLITGSSVDQSTPLSPTFPIYRMNMTEKVRLKGVIERTRLHAVKLLEGNMEASDPPMGSVSDISERGEGQMEVEIETETETGVGISEYPQGNEELEIEVSKVYYRCMVQLGESLKTDL